MNVLRQLLGVVCGVAVGLASAPSLAGEVTVFAASSLKTALDEIAVQWQTSSGHTMRVSYAGSSALARQIQHGAPADIFISANVDWMDVLEQQGVLRDNSRRDLLGNRLVLIGTDSAPAALVSDDILDRLNGGPLAMAMVSAVPAGIYGVQAWTALNIWDDLKPHVAQTDNVRSALALVALGEANLGVVYASDVVVSPNVHVVASFPQALHDPIVYPVAQISENPLNISAMTFLAGVEATEIFRQNGFTVLESQ